MIDIVADSGWLGTTIQIEILLQMLVQGAWYHMSSLLTLPNVEKHMLHAFRKCQVTALPEFIHFKGMWNCTIYEKCFMLCIVNLLM